MEYLIDTSVLPILWRNGIVEFAIEPVVRCEDCMWYDDGYCHVWEAETLPDGWCYQGAESDEDYKELIEEVRYVPEVGAMV